jgi:hypothetical protein
MHRHLSGVLALVTAIALVASCSKSGPESAAPEAAPAAVDTAAQGAGAAQDSANAAAGAPTDSMQTESNPSPQ